MKRLPRGLTLIEIAIVMTIVGFVATFALPAWRDHTVRAKVAEVIAAAAPAKATVEDYVADHGALPSPAAIALPFLTSQHAFTSAWAASGASGALTVSTKAAVGRDEAALDRKAIVLTATLDTASKSVRWVCGGTPATTIDARFLPPDCQ